MKEMKKKKKSREIPASSYITTPYRFPAEQVDIVRRLKPKKRRKKK